MTNPPPPQEYTSTHGTTTQLQVQFDVGNLATWAGQRKPINTQPDNQIFMPDYNQYLERIFEILKPLAKKGVILNENTELVTELGLTSLQVMELIEQIEDHFDMSIPLNILPDIRSVHDLAVQLEKLER